MTNDFVNPHSPYCVLPSHWLNPSVSMGSWLYLKFKSNTICVEEMGQDMPLSLSHSILATGQDNELI